MIHPGGLCAGKHRAGGCGYLGRRHTTGAKWIAQGVVTDNRVVPTCIYCGGAADSPEHWLPRSLGTFGDLQVLQDTICAACNKELGDPADHSFLRVGPEAVHRTGLGVQGRRGSGGNPFYYQAATLQPVEARSVGAEEEDSEVFWEILPGEGGAPQGQLMRQVIIIDAKGRRRAVPINLQWTPEVLREAIKSRGIEGGTLSELYVDEEDLQTARKLLSAVLPGFKVE
jgi:hypothetical protein